jgi:hypothetical protein
MAKSGKGVERWAHFKDDIPAVTAVAAIRAAAHDKFFAVHVDHAVTTLAGFYKYFCLIDKHIALFVSFEGQTGNFTMDHARAW